MACASKIPLNSPVISCGSRPPSLHTPQKTAPSTFPAVFAGIKTLCDWAGGRRKSNLMKSNYDKLEGEWPAARSPPSWPCSLNCPELGVSGWGPVLTQGAVSDPAPPSAWTTPRSPPFWTRPAPSPRSFLICGPLLGEVGRRGVFLPLSSLSRIPLPNIFSERRGRGN